MQSLFFSPCSEGLEEKSIRKGEPVTICAVVENSPRIRYIRLRRSPLPIGLFIHYQKILPTQIRAYSTIYTVDGLPTDFSGSYVEYTFSPIATWYYNMSIVYTLSDGTEQETQQSGSVKIIVTP